MVRMDIVLEDDALLRLEQAVQGKLILPATSAAFLEGAKIIQKMWQSWAMGANIDGAKEIKSANGKIASSIKIRRLNDFDIEIFSDSPEMLKIEQGTPEFDMKKTYPFGKKSRVSAANVPYLIIPFRWRTPTKKYPVRFPFSSMLTNAIYRSVKNAAFKKSVKKQTTHIERNFRGESIERAEYSWGTRLKDDSQDYENGMVRMKAKSRSNYFTFRIISPKSSADKWIKKEIPPNPVTSAIKTSTQEQINSLIQKAVESDFS